MKRSTTVQLTLLSSVAALLIGCRSQQVRRCVDESQTVVDEQNCLAQQSSGFHGGYHWYYGGPSGYMPMGTRMSGGSSTGGGSSTSDSGTTHGVVGSAGEAASGHSSGGDGGAGE